MRSPSARPRRRPQLFPLLLLASVVAPGAVETLAAQRVASLPPATVRYELGKRLRDLEAALETARGAGDEAAIERAMPLVDEAVRSFFGLRFDRAAERLDAARFALEAARPAGGAETSTERAHARLAFVPAARVLDPTVDRTLTVAHGWVYAPGRDADDRAGPPGLRYRIEHRLVGPDGGVVARSAAVEFDDLTPGQVVLDLPETGADVDLVLESVTTPRTAGDAPAADTPPPLTRRATVSLVRDAAARAEALAALEAEARRRGLATAAATVEDYARTFRVLLAGRALETDVPAARLLEEAEGIARHLADGEDPGPYFAAPRHGERWIHLAVTPDGDAASSAAPTLVPMRLWTPEARGSSPAGARVPLVVALHGAGGSEHMFFDGYGAGLGRRLAAARGWAFVAPRTQTPTEALVAMVDELARRYPIDPDRVVLLGHSMGAAKAVTLLQAAPGRFAAAAPLGGGGRLRQGAAVDGLPVLVGCGDRDFALGGARSLHRALDRAGARATLRVVPGIEHLTIVQIALPEAYSFFDGVVGR